MPTKEIYFILEASSRSGGVRVIYEYANRLAAIGYHVHFATLDKKPDWFKLNNGVKWIKYDDYEIMVRSLIGLKPDIVVATWWATAHPAATVAEETGCRGLYLVQDIETSYYSNPVHKRAVRSTYELGLEHFTTSKWVQSIFDDGKLPGGCHYTGIAIGRWSANAASVRRGREVLACLRRQHLKGFSQLSEVARRIAPYNLRFLTYGADPGIGLTVFHEHAANMTDGQLAKLYASVGVFISTSIHEGFSMTPLEAMLAGCPVVMTDADGNMEYAVDGENCLIATDPTDMAEKIVRVINDQDLSRRLSKFGRSTAQGYTSWDGPVARLRSLIDRDLQPEYTEGEVQSTIK